MHCFKFLPALPLNPQPEEPMITPVRAPPTEAAPSDDEEDAGETSGQEVELTAERGEREEEDCTQFINL